LSDNQKSWRDVIKVHPAAAVFPRMSDAEMRQLAEDIRDNGLQNPVTTWIDPHNNVEWVIDGRNRLDAMEMVGIDFRNHLNRTDGNNIASRVIALNIKRRHLTAIERAALAVAAIEADTSFQSPGQTVEYSTVSKGGRGKKGLPGQAAELVGVDKKTVLQAIAVRNDPELFNKVKRRRPKFARGHPLIAQQADKKKYLAHHD
jgi:hypothetical protein